LSKQISHLDELELIQLVGQFSFGATLNEIMAALSKKIPRRTLQYRLSKLVSQGRLVMLAHGRSSCYSLPPATHVAAVHSVKPPKEIIRIVPLSISAKKIREEIRRPMAARKPVGYNHAFLDEYQPNKTSYLSPNLKRHLNKIGGGYGEKRPAGTWVKQIFNRLLIDLSWNSSRLEGNTYSLLETERLLAFGEAAEGKSLQETVMILNHKSAIEFLVEYADEASFNRYTVLNLHALLSANLLPDPAACGRLRRIAVGIHGTVYHPPAIPQLIEEYFQQILHKANLIKNPFEQAFFVLVHFPYLQPFEDVNKRVSRLAANLPLIRDNLCPLSFIDVPEGDYIDGMLGIYELNRIEILRDIFIWAYERSCQHFGVLRQQIGEPDPLHLQYRDLLKETISGIVQKKMNKSDAMAFIRQQISRSALEEHARRLIEIIETEILGLHEGNIARYHLNLSDYNAWKTGWF